jgi:hypothetical protein
MKRLFPFLLAGMLASPALAQQLEKHAVTQPQITVPLSALQSSEKSAEFQTQSTLDTLDQYLGRSTALQVYSYPFQTSGGIVNLPITGTNNLYQFLGIKYNFSGTATLRSLLVLYASKLIQHEPDTFMASVFNLPTASNPTMSQLGNQLFSADQIDTNSAHPIFTVINFDTPVPVNSDFVVMVQTIDPHSADLDFVSIFSNQQGDGDGEKRASIFGVNQQSQLYTADLADLFTINDVPIDIDPIIVPVIETDAASGVEDYVTLDGLTLKGAFPSPASDRTTVNFAVDKPSSIEISIIDMTGRVISTIHTERVEAGNHTHDLDVSALPAGSYMYTVSTGTARVAGKLAITR